MSEWIKKSISEVCDIKHGYAFSGEHITTNEAPYILVTPGNFSIGGGFKISNNQNLDFTSYNVNGMFIINTPTFYMFCSKYLTIDIEHFELHLKGRNVYPDLTLPFEVGTQKIYTYPYFK